MNLKSLNAIMTAVVLGSLVLVATLPGRVHAAGTAAVTVAAPAQAVSPGQQFSVNINVDPNNAIAGAQFTLSFNPSLASATSVSQGNLLNQGGANTYFMAGQINNAAGTISAVAGAIVTPGQTVSTPGTFATINFTASATQGTCPLNLSNVIVGDINGLAVTVSTANGQVVNGQPSSNQAPVLGPVGNKSVNGGSLLLFTVSATDADGDPLSYSASNLPAGATFNASAHIFSWTPSSGQVGTYPSVHFQVTDGSLTDSEDITITVSAPGGNQAPTLAFIGSKSVTAGQMLSFTISASDPDGDALTYSASNLPSGATFNASARLFSWTPTSGQVGTHPNVHFQASDGSLMDSEDITITVNTTPPVNQAPTLAFIGNKSVTAGQPLTFTISASDPNGDSLTYSASNLPSGATFTASTRAFSWTPTSGQVGSYPNVHFQVTDGSLIDSEDITITVNAAPGANQAPVLSAIGSKSATSGQLLQFGISASDPNGDTLTYSASNLPSGATFSAGTRTLSWTPTSNQVGTYTGVHFQVSDGSLTDSEDISITVSSPAPPAGGGGAGGMALGGGGGGAPTGPGVTNLSLFTNGEGLFNLSATASSEDGKAQLEISKGVQANVKDGGPLKSASINEATDSGRSAGWFNPVGFCIRLRSGGRRFQSADHSSHHLRSLAFSRRADGEEPSHRRVGIQAAGKWVEAVSAVDATSHTISTALSQLGRYAVIAHVRPASIAVSGLSISPERPQINERVAINVTVSNTGDIAGSREVILTLSSGNVSETLKQTVQVAGGASREGRIHNHQADRGNIQRERRRSQWFVQCGRPDRSGPGAPV